MLDREIYFIVSSESIFRLRLNHWYHITLASTQDVWTITFTTYDFVEPKFASQASKIKNAMF